MTDKPTVDRLIRGIPVEQWDRAGEIGQEFDPPIKRPIVLLKALKAGLSYLERRIKSENNEIG